MQEISRSSPAETPLQVTQARIAHTRFFLVSRVFTRRNNTNNHLYVSIRGSVCPSMKTRAGLECRERVKPTASNLPSVFFFFLSSFFSSFANNGSPVSLLPMSMHWLRSNLVTVCETRRDYLWIYFQRRERRRSWLVHGIRGE